MTPAKKGRVFSGARPTGRQHLGNYLGAIQNYVALQDEYQECVYCIVDIHALTTVETTENLRQNTYEMALDWLVITVLTALTGGVESPAIIFFLFHISIAGLLLPHERVFLYVALAPAMVVNKNTYGRMKAERVTEILNANRGD